MKPDSIQFIHFLSLTTVLTLMILSFWIGKHAPLLLSHLTQTKPKHSAWALLFLGFGLLVSKTVSLVTLDGPASFELRDEIASLSFLMVGSMSRLLHPNQQNRSPQLCPRSNHRLVPLFGLFAAISILERPLFLTVKGHQLATLEGTWNEGVCLQSTQYTCVSASGASAFKAIGVNVTEGELAYLTRTTWRGATFQSMKGAVEKIGQKLDLEIHLETRTMSWNELIQLDSPALLETVWEGTIGHSTAYLGSRDGHAILGEPLTGRVTVDENSLKGPKWNWNGVAHVFVMRCSNN